MFNDTLGMETSDVMIFDYLPHAQGTICELDMHNILKEQVRRILRFMSNVLTLDKEQDIFQMSKIAEFSINQYVWRDYGCH